MEEGGPTALFDTTPETFPNLDAPLLAGRGFVDPVGRIHIQTVEASQEGLVVRVTLGYTDAAPAAAAGIGHAFPGLLAHTHSGATATDADLSSYRWAFASCPSTCPPMTKETGAIHGASDDVPGSTYTANAPGVYRLTLTVRDAAGHTTTSTTEETAL